MRRNRLLLAVAVGGVLRQSARGQTDFPQTIQSGSVVVMSQPNVVLPSLLVEQGATLDGNGNFSVLGDLTNQGLLENLGGTVGGTLTNSGTATIAAGEALYLPQSGNSSGEIDESGGSINAPQGLVNTGAFNWSGGSIFSSLENLGTLTLAGSRDQILQAYGTLSNSGTVTQSGGANLTLAGYTFSYYNEVAPAVIMNQSGGVYDIRGDVGIAEYPTVPNVVPNDAIDNAGVFEKTSGTGTSAIGCEFNNTGTILAGSGSLNLTNGLNSSGTLRMSAGATLSAADVTLSGGQIVGPGTLAAASVSINGNVAIASAPTLQVSSLSFSAASSLDVGSSKLVLQGLPIAAIQNDLASGFNDGTWNGPGITSSAVAALNAAQTNRDTVYALGYAKGADGVVSGLSAGQVEVLPTLAGDATLSGTVDYQDLLIVMQNFGKSAQTWDEGDFDYSPTVDFYDMQVVLANFGKSAGGLAAAQASAELGRVESIGIVPEPGGFGLVVIAIIGALARRLKSPRRDRS